MNSPDKKVPKKPYHPPRLLLYGDLRTLTQATSNMGTPDGSTKMFMNMS
jgi:hypothetical protein